MHLIRRFFGFLRARPLTPLEQRYVNNALRVQLARAFFAQRHEDQRHALEVERRIGQGTCTEAALLHDIGKSESNLGAFSRSLATIWHGIGLGATGRWQLYLTHGALGADTLESLGANELAVAFTRYHPGPSPTGIDPAAWRLLEDADNA